MQNERDKKLYIVDKTPLKKISDQNDKQIIKNIALFILSSQDYPEIKCTRWDIDCNSSKSFYFLIFQFPKNAIFSLKQLNSFFQINPLLIDDINVQMSTNTNMDMQLNISLRKQSSSIHLSINKIEIIKTAVMSQSQVNIIDEQEVQNVLNNNKKRKF